ncbi:CHAT domain-containing protein [Suillus lakei]|nr:CHAT domain-containing protein [Suillus lakei]
MPGSLQGQYIGLEVISGKNIQVPFIRIPAGIYVSIKLDSRRRWSSTVQVLSSKSAVAWGDTLTISPDASPKLSLEIRASFELGRMLGNGKVISKLETSWNELLDHGDEPFDLSFSPIDDICPSLTLKVTSVHACGHDDGTLIDESKLQSGVECEISRRTHAGHTRLFKYMRSNSGVSHLNGAVNYFQWVVAQCSVGHPDRAAALTNLAWARLRGYIHEGAQYIDSMTSLFRDALALRPQGHLDHPLSLYNLATALTWCYSKDSTIAIIHECAQLCCQLLPLCPEGTYLRSFDVDSAVNYVIGTCIAIPVDASDEGIHLRRLALELCPLGHQHHLRTFYNLSSALYGRFLQCGSIVDIDESIQLGRDILSLCLEGHSSRDTYLNDLALSLATRFTHEGRPHDLDEAISLGEEALRLRPLGHKCRDIPLSNLGTALQTRFIQRSDVNDINRAIGLAREALKLCPSGLPRRDAMLANLATALTRRYNGLHVIEDINEAIELYRESLRLTQPDNLERHKYQTNLSSALCSRFMHNQKNKDVEEAIYLGKDSLAAVPLLHPERHYSYFHLRQAYMSRYSVQHNPADLSLAVENFRLASKHPTQGFPERIWEAIEWARQADYYRHESALEAYQMCLELFDRHVMTRSSIISRRNAATALRGAQSLPVDAASCAIRRNDLRQAVALEEQGRGQQWSLASRLRTPLDDLKSVSLPLAHKLSEVSKRLSEAQGSTGSTDGAAADLAVIAYRRLTTEWEATVTEIRQLHDFSRFLLPPGYEDLQAAACHGPVIILIASHYSCNAIIVPTSGEPRHVPFPSLTLAELKKLKDDFARAIRQANIMAPTKPRTELMALLRFIWDEVMLPVVNLTPLERSQIALGENYAWRIYICSYTPTLSALIRARQTMKTRVTPSFVAIGQGQPGGGQGTALAAVDSELELVQKLVPPNVKFTSLSGDESTQAGVLEALRRNTWVHLACHGKQDREQPYNSRFAMRDKPLTLLDIMENDAPQAEFAFLSACHTAVGDEQTPDEVIHLAAGLQFSGFKSVIGTLWVVDDAVAKHVVEAFYEKMFKDLEEGVMDCTRAAWALNHATCTVKKEVALAKGMMGGPACAGIMIRLGTVVDITKIELHPVAASSTETTSFSMIRSKEAMGH